MENKLILKEINKYIFNNPPPTSISKLGFFGSSTTQCVDQTNDIDILIFENINFKNELDIIYALQQSIAKKHIGDITILNTYTRSAHLYLINLSNYLKIPLKMALGPVINEPNKQYLHINASFNKNLWDEFSKRLPIHAHLISTNYIPVIGDKPVSVKLSELDFVQYIELMDARFSNYRVTENYLRKIIKSLALFHRYNSTDYVKCLDFLFRKKIISKILLLKIKDAKEEDELMKVYLSLKHLFYV